MPKSPRRNRRIWPLLALVAAGSVVVHAESVPTAQPDPALARGFAPEQLYQGFAELDRVNAFNGNLTVPLPIGQEYPLGGGFSYQLSLVYNSQIWDIQTVNNGLGSWNKARLARSSNAGIAWSVNSHPDRAQQLFRPSAGDKSPDYERRPVNRALKWPEPAFEARYLRSQPASACVVRSTAIYRRAEARITKKIAEGIEVNVVQRCMNATTGFLESRRILEGSVRGPDDLLVAFESDAAGNVATERFYGGDGAGLSTAACAVPSGSVPFRQDHEYTAGSAGHGTITFSNFDALGNPRSQSISGSSQFNLDFVFDKANRLIRVDAGGRPLKEFFFARSDRSATDRSAGKLVLAKRHNYLIDPASGEEIDVIISERTEYAGRGGRVSRRITSANRSFLQPDSSIAFETSIFYDVLGQPDTLIYPTCLHSCSAPARTVFFDYGRGRLTGVVGYASSIRYHANGMLAAVDHANGAGYSIANDPNSMRRPLSITLTDGNGVSATLGPFGCDGASNMMASGPEFYVFDGVSRLVEATFGSGSGQTYAFDAFGNMTSITTTTGGVQSMRAIGVSASTNRLTSAVYDAAGNKTSWNGNAYAYDAVSMMTSLNGSKLYVYDADDMRVMLFDSAAGEERWRLRGLGQEVLRENVRTTTGWQWSRDYVFRDGEVLASISAEGTRHQHPNHLGTPRVITDESGLIVASQLLRPFGEEASGSGAARGFLKFTGHERDFNGSSAVNHLDYMRARYYSPHLGRFLSPDPKNSAEVANPQSWNRYAYALNNPLKYIDPDGQESLAALRLDMDIQAVASGEMSSAEFQERNKARAAGVAVAASLTVPGPEDVALTFAARTRLGASITGRIGGFFRRLFKRSDTSSRRAADISARINSLTRERRALEQALSESRQQLDNGRNQAARIRNAGEDINPHGLGKEINETLPAEIAAKEARIREIAEELTELRRKE